MTSSKKHRASTKRPPSKHRATLAAYTADKRHLTVDESRARFGLDPVVAKTVRQIAAETGMSERTARRWLERDHYDEWFRWWPSFAAVVADAFEGCDLNRAPADASAFVDRLPDLDAAATAAADDIR